MSRADQLLEELNRGVKVEEKTNQVISGWTPNNLKRLVISPSNAIVEYHCVPQGTRYSNLVNVLRFKKEALNADIDKINKERYTGVLTCLLENRVNSCIEEIVFCKDPQGICNIDINIFMAKNSGQLNTKFPRLRYISILDTSIQELVQGYNADKHQFINNLLTDTYETQVVNKVYIGPEDYKTKTYLRPQHYTLDAPDGLLHKRLKAVKQEYTEQQEKIEQRDIDFQAIKGLIRKHDEFINTVNTVLALDKLVYQIIENQNNISSSIAKNMLYEFMQFDKHLEDACKKTRLDLSTLDFKRAIKTLERVCSECDLGVEFDSELQNKLEDLAWLSGYFNKLNESKDVDDFNNIQTFIGFLKTIVITWYIASMRATYDTLKYAVNNGDHYDKIYASYRGMYKQVTGHIRLKFHTSILEGLFEEDNITDTKMSNAKEQFGITYNLTDSIDIGNTTGNLLKMIALWVTNDTMYVSPEIKSLGEVK